MQTARASTMSRRLPSVPWPRRCFPRSTTSGRPLPSCARASHPRTRSASPAAWTASTASSSPPTPARASRSASRSPSTGERPMRKRMRPTTVLWNHQDFMKLWTGQSISEFGTQISGLAFPWFAAVSLHASPFEFSLLGVLAFLPFILFALPAGVWVDRLRRKPILIVGDAGRAALLAYIPIAWFGGWLEMHQLLALAFAIGVLTVFFDVAYQSYLPSLVERDDLVEGNSKLQTTASAANVTGPPIAGLLISAISAPYAIIVDAISFVVSTLFMLRIRKPETHQVTPSESSPRPKMWPELKEGLRFVTHHPHLRWIAVCTGTANFFGTIAFAIGLLFMQRSLSLTGFWVGFI